LRRAVHGHHVCTAEVAAVCLALAGEDSAAERLLAWLDVFTTHSLSVRQSLPLDRNSPAHQRLQALSTAPATSSEGMAAQSVCR
jgi:DTW domain-containing protein YfiP